MRRAGRKNPALFWLGTAAALAISGILVIAALGGAKGSVLILERPGGSGFLIKFTEWSAKEECKLILEKEDELQIELSRGEGKLALAVCGKNGAEPYTGNDLKPGRFTVTVPEPGEYLIKIKGERVR